MRVRCISNGRPGVYKNAAPTLGSIYTVIKKIKGPFGSVTCEWYILLELGDYIHAEFLFEPIEDESINEEYEFQEFDSTVC